MRHSLHTKFAKSLVCASIFATLLLFAGRAAAQTNDYWINTATTATLTATSNWQGGAVPTSTQVATYTITPTGVPTIILTANITVAAFDFTSTYAQAPLIEANATSTLTLDGATINGVANTVLANFGSGEVEFENGSKNLTMSLGTSGGAWILGGAGTNAALGPKTYIKNVITGTGSQPITYLGYGTYDPNYNYTTFVNGGEFELGGTNTFTGGITIGDNSGSPTYGNSGTLEINSISAIDNVSGNNITINNNSQLLLNVVGTYTVSNVTLTINGLGNFVNHGAINTNSSGSTNWNGAIVLGSTAEIDNTSGNFLNLSGPVTGNYQLQIQGKGTDTFSNAGNTWGSTQIGNGIAYVPSGGSFSAGALQYYNQTSDNLAIYFNQASQTIAGLYNGSTPTSGSGTYVLGLNNTALTVNQPSGTSDFRGNSGTYPYPLNITGSGSIIYNGPGTLIIGSAATNFTGGITVNSGTLLVAPWASTSCSINSPVKLSGGTFGTTGILGTAVNVYSLTLTSSSTIALDATTTHTLNFTNSSAATWTAGQTLTITGWVGSTGGYSTSAGATGAVGHIYFGTNASGLTAGQLAHIQFYDGTNYYPAVLLSSGELVPAPTITTTAAAFGPFCSGVANGLSVAFTPNGTFTGTYSVQLSNASGSFTSGTTTLITSGSSSPLSATIPAGITAGTGYRVRVINSAPADSSSTDNDSDINVIASPMAYTVGGSGAICPGATGVDIQLSNSQTGVNYQLYNGATEVGSAMPGTTGSVVDFGSQTAAGTYTVLATSTGTGGCTQVMNGSGSVTVNPEPGVSISGTTLIAPGQFATLTFADTNSVNGDVIYFTDGTTTYSVTMVSSRDGATFNTPALSATTTYSVTSATSVLSCVENITGQTVTIYVSATPTAIITGATTICPASEGGEADLTFTGTASGIVNYTDGVSTYSVALSSGSGGIGTADIIVTPSTTTTYSLISIVSGGTYTVTGSATVTISTLPTVYNMTGGGYCAGTAGTTIGLDGSDGSTTTYQLYNGTTPEGSAVAGASGAISLGVYSATGTYTVLATNSIGCYDAMSGFVTPSVNPLPSPYTVGGTGSYCNGGGGYPTSLSNTQIGVKYQLYNGATVVGLPVEGFGGATGFGDQPAGTYTVLGTYTLTGCSNGMTGSAVITSVNPLSAGGITGPTVINSSASMTLSDATGASGGVWSSTNTTAGTINSTTGVFSALAAGSTTISYTVTNACGPVATTSGVNVYSVTTGEVVMSQVYGDAGGSSAAYNTAYIELFNHSASAVTMTNWSVQFGTASNAWTSNTFSGIIGAHSYFLIALKSGSNGSSLPTPDFAPASPITMNTSTGIVALVANGTTISSVPSDDATSVLAADNIVDFVGYGSGAASYLLGYAPSTSATLADFRGLGGCTNGGNNSTDFTAATPSPRNSSSPINVCPTPTAYYSAATGNLDNTATWGTNTDGSGTTPPNFTTELQTFHIANGNPGSFSAAGTWTVSGSGSVVNVDDGTDFTIPSTTTVNATVNVGANRTLTIANSTLPVFGSLDIASTIAYSGLTGLNLPTSLTYGNLTLTNTTVTNTTSATLSFVGNITLTGTSSVNATGCTVEPTGTGNQTISGNGTILNLAGFTDSKTAGTVTLASGANLNLYDGSLIMALSGGASNQFSDGGNTIFVGNNMELSGTANSYNLTGTINMDGPTAETGTQQIEGSGSSTNCVAALNNLVISGGLKVKINNTTGYTLTVNGNLIFSAASTSAATLNFLGNTIALGGNFYDSTTTDQLLMTTAGSKLTFSGSSAQQYYSSVSGGNTPVNLTMNNTSGGLTLLSPLNVSGVLTLTNGIIATGSNALTLTSTGSVTAAGSSSYINGSLVENIHSGGTSSLSFPVGDATYAPVQLTYGSTITGASVEVTSTAGENSAISTSGISTSNDVNRYWTITDNGTTASGTTVNVALDYNAADLTGASNSGYLMKAYNGSSWSSEPSIVNSTSGVSPLPADATTSTGISGSSYSGTYIAGGISCPNVYSMTGGGNYCPGTSGRAVGLGGSDNGVSYVLYNGATSVYTVTGTGSSVSFGSQLAGVYSVVGTNIYSGCSTNMSGTETVTLNPAPTATITGTASICSGSTAVITATGTAYATVYLSDGITNFNIGIGGTGTGTVTPSIATVYTGTVTSTLGCSAPASGSAVISILPTSAGTVASASICGIASTSTLSSTITGGSWTSGNTSVATIGTSGIATGVSYGTAIVTYTIANICNTYSTTATVSVNPAPAAPVVSSSLLSFCSTSPAELVSASGDTVTGSFQYSTTPVAVGIAYSVTGTNSSSISTSLPAGAIITVVRATINQRGTPGSSNSKQENFGFNLKAPNGNIICLTDGGGSSTSDSGYFRNIEWGSDGTVADPIAGTAYVTGTDYKGDLVSGIPSYATNQMPTADRSNVTSWSSLFSVPNGTWTLYYAGIYNNTSAIDTFQSWSITVNYIIPPTSVTWAPLAGLYTTSAGSGGSGNAYSDGSTNSVYVQPTTNTTYTVTATTGSCTSASTILADYGASLYVPSITSSASAECVGISTIAETDSSAGGVWTSNNTSIASVGSGSGIVTGEAGGTTTITYTITSGSCSGYSTTNVTINALPTLGGISGTTNLCTASLPSTLSDSPTGGVWSSGNTAVATIDPSSGALAAAGTNVGTATITYTYTNSYGCITTNTTPSTITSLPSVLTISPAIATMCTASSPAMLVATGGVLSGPATNNSGTITGIDLTPASSVATYSLAISGIPTAATISNISVTIDFNSQYLNQYRFNLKAPNGTIINLVNDEGLPGAGLFTNTVLSSNGTTALSTGGSPYTGTYKADIATGANGGIPSYSATATSWSQLYTTGSSADGAWTLIGYNTYTGTTASPNALTGFNISVNYTAPVAAVWSPTGGLYTNSGGGIGYSSSAIDTVYAYPTSNGSYTYTATASNGSCSSSASGVVILNSTLTVPAIAGDTSVCLGVINSLSDPSPGGIWSSNNTAIATVDGSGNVTGLTAGATTTITYSLTTGACSGYITQNVTINALPSLSPISGNTGICLTSPTVSLSDVQGGGTWSSSNTAVATISSASGLATGLLQGNTIVTYNYSNGTCSNSVTTNVLVSKAAGIVTMFPASVSLCPSSGTPLMLTASGGLLLDTTTVSSGIISVVCNTVAPTATALNVSGIPAGAVVTGIAANFNITEESDVEDVELNLVAPNNSVINLYSSSSSTVTGFSNTTVSSAGTTPFPSSGGGPFTGVWAASESTNAALSKPFTTYSVTTTSWTPLEAANPNGTWMLAGLNNYKTDAFVITSWSITVYYTVPPTTATVWSPVTSLYTNIDTTGTDYTGSYSDTVYALPATTTDYTATTTYGACSSSNNVSVNVSTTLIVSSITGTTNVCTAATTPLTDLTVGGVWSSNNTDVATVGSSTGIVTAIDAGSATISYTLTSGVCSGYNTTGINVNPLPSVNAVTGNANLCFGSSYIDAAPTSTLSDGTASGIWSSSNALVATVGSTGILSGVAAGSSIISYTYNNGTCSNSATVNAVVSAAPLPIYVSPSATSICSNGPASMLITSGGDIPQVGSWSNSSTYVAYGSTATSPSGPAVSPITVSIPSNATITDMSVKINAVNVSSAYNSNMIFNLLAPDGATILNLVNEDGGNTNLKMVNTIISSEGTPSVSATSVFSVTNTYGAALGNNVGYSPYASTTNRWTDLFNTASGVWKLIGDDTYKTGSADITSWTITVYYTVPSTTVTWSNIAGLYTNTGGTSYAGSATDTVYALPTSTSTYTVTSSNGVCASTSTASVTVNPSPTVSGIMGANSVCANSTLSLSDASSGTSTLWSSSNTSVATVNSSGLVNATNTSGTATITYSVTNSFGCSNVATKTITVNPLPTTAASNSSPACVGGTVTLNSIATGASGYSWNGPSGFNSLSVNPTLTGATLVSGVYSVTVSNTYGCSAMSTTTVTVNTLVLTPTNTSPLCAAGTVNLVSGESGTATGVGYQWNGPAGFNATTSTATVNIINVTNAGSYTVTASNASSGCSATATTIVTVNTITISPTNSGYACSGGSENLYSGETGTAPSVFYLWSGPGGYTSTSSSPVINSVLTAMTGIYTVTATSTVTGCNAAGTTTVTIDTISVSPYNSGYACNGGTVDLYSVENGTAPSVTYAWHGPDSYTSTVANPVFNSAAMSRSGTYTVTASSGGSGCIATGTTSVTVDTFNVLLSNNGPACVGTSVSLAAALVGTVSPVYYAWNGPNVFSSMSADTVVTDSAILAMGGVYTLSIGASGNGCSVTKTMNVIVNAIPVPISGNLNVCIGLTRTLTDGSTGGTWTSGSSNAMVGASTGIVTGESVGTATIYYTFGTTCSVNTIVTINPDPAAITPVSNKVCIGSVITLSDATPLGSWLASNSNATVDSVGDVQGVTAGTVNITYLSPGGCYSKNTVTVNSLPAIIYGSTTVCTGSTTTLSDATAGGTWSSSNTSAATIGSSGSPVTLTGVDTGTTIIVYTSAAGCTRYTDITVNAAPVISGTPASVCVGSTVMLSDNISGGTWSSSAVGKGTVSATGIVYGVASGTTTISYQTLLGCTAKTVVTVNAISAIHGTAVFCQGSTTTLSDATSGGTWTSTNGSVATFGGSTGLLTSGSTADTVTVIYQTGLGCTATALVTVNPITAIMELPLSVCVGTTDSLWDNTPGGAWSSSAVGKGTVSATGVVYGVASGTTTITYLIAGTGCKATGVVSVNAISAIHGGTVMCSGSTLTLSDATAGGTWTSSDTLAATIGSSGSPVTVTGVPSSTTNTTTITYATSAGCTSNITITVNPTPVIGGANKVCLGLGITLSTNVSGGTWSSSSTTVATVDESGDVSGLSAGTSKISYVSSLGCSTGVVVSVNSNPVGIFGSKTVCPGSTLSLSDVTAGGSWSASGNVTLAGSGGNVIGGSPGTGVVAYTLGTGCMVTDTVTVATPPTALGTIAALCAGSSETLSDGVSGGTWSSSNTYIATIGSSSGLLTAVSGGLASINYTTASGCSTSQTVSVNAILPISGSTNICLSGTTSLSDVGGGTWSTSSTAISVGDSSGIVTGLSVDTATVIYSLASGCSRSILVNVNPLPDSILGVKSLCQGTTTTLSDDGGGSWSMSSSYASIGVTSGVVTAVSSGLSGTATVIYTAGAGCSTTTVITVNPNPSAIQGASSECQGVTITLTDLTGGGSWSGAEVVAASGTTTTLTGTTIGSNMVSYTLGTGCFVTLSNVVSSNPPAIVAPAAVCVGLTTALSDSITGGTWTSSNTSVATFYGQYLTGQGPGTDTITYKVSGCSVTTTLVVDNLPTISGNSAGSICTGGSLSLTAGAGTWSSSNTSVATVGASGIVNALSGGTATISFAGSGGTGCVATTVVTVTTVPAITGAGSLCSNTTIKLNDGSTGGAWVSGNTSVATITGGTGVVSGVGSGTVVITYTALSSCMVTATLTVNAAPQAISGNLGVCLGIASSLTDTTTGGTWSSSNSSIVSIGISSGVVNGLYGGVQTISYMLSSGCYVTAPVTVNAQPGSIHEPAVVCAGSVYSLSDGTSGGTWSSSAVGTATVNATSGSVSGISAGTTIISYIISGTGCNVAATLMVNASPAPLVSTGMCAGSTITLTDTVYGGSWAVSNPLISVDGFGDVTADSGASGNAIVTYTLPSGCLSTATITVTNLPSAITGITSVCSGLTVGLSNTLTGGLWSTGNGSVASIGSTTGVVLGISSGTSMVTYSVGAGCMASEAVTVYALPKAITGDSLLCAGTSSALVDTGSGTWSMSSLYATVNSSTGVVTAGTGLSGVATVTYTAAVTGCIAVYPVTVNPNPTAIQGPASECQGATITLTDVTGGGSWSGTGVTVASGTTTTLTGITVGSSTITYMLGTGCSVTLSNIVIANPSAIVAPGTVCIGSTTALSDGTSGGTWTSSNASVATIYGQYLTGQGPGTDTVTYTASGCSVTTTVSVISPSTYAIGSNPGISECPGVPFTLTDGASGNWSSSNTGIAMVNTDGTVTGVSGGTATITFTASGVSGCTATTLVTINTAPAITGSMSICSNGSVTLNDGSGGGTWSGNSGSVATVGSSTGLVTATGVGTVTIAYKTSGGCTVTAIVTVNGAPTAIGGATNKVCAGNTITLTDNTAPGVWSSSNTAVGTVDVTGDITGIGTGTTLITYNSGGCSVSAVVTVNGLPGVINGASGVCSGSTITLTDISTGGTWSITGATGSLIGSATGVVTGGSSGGTATVSYTIASTGCSIGDVLTISTTAGAIGGSGQVCVGLSDQLTDAGGGTWSSSSTTVAQIGSTTGLLVGEASGTATISYLSGGCYAKTVVTVSALPGVIKGLTSVCQGLTLSLSDATTGGTWSSTNITVGTVGSTGLVTSLITGATIAATDSIIYKSAAGCTASVSITVNPLPQAIHGDTSLCQGKATTLTDGSEPGGTWSLIGSVATIVGSSGVITAASSGANGVVTVSYTSGGCSVTKVVSVNSNPSAVQGVGTACVGTTVMLTDLTAGGSWSSTGAASISGAGTTTTFVGSTAGTVSITYMIAATGCISQSFTTTIVANPAPIAGVFSLCTGVTTQLSDPSAGGGWTSGNTAVATVSGAYVTGHMAGTAILTYVLSGCSATQAVTMTQTPVVGVIGAPATISFAGGAVTISDTTAGGIWTSSNPATIELLGSTGTSVSAEALTTSGSSVISYTVTNGICATTVTKTIGAATAVRPGGGTGTGGTTVVYVGTAATLPADELSGGLWSSSDNSIATVDGNGVVTGMMPGIAMITHEVTGDDGTVTANVTDVVVTAVPASISLVPNPNKGTFVVKGTLGTQTNEEVTLEVTDVLGQVLYSGKVMTDGGRLNATVNLSNVVANGMYMLNVKSGTENKTLHFVIEQ